MGSEFARDSALSPPESLSTDRPSIAAFCDAIRAKKDWSHKIPDTTRNLGLKWATEAGIDDPANDGVFPALEELKNEAQRIIFSDFEIRLNDHVSSKEPESGLDVQSLDSEILASLRYAAAAPYGVRPLPNLAEEVGIFVSASLHRELVAHLDALAMQNPPDLHPGSHGKVHDLIHPSLYPLVLGESVLDEASNIEALPSLFSTEVSMSGIELTLSSRYAWIPSIFKVSEDGSDVHIESYINGLGPREHHPHLYRLIEKVSLLVLPHFRRTLDFEYEHDHSLSVWRWRERYDFRNENEDAGLKRSAWEKFLENQTAEKNAFKAELEKISKGVPKETDVDATDRTHFATDNTVEAFSF